MANYITQAQDRLTALADRFYGQLTNESYLAITVDNPTWDGEGIQLGGVSLSIPEPLPTIPINPAVRVGINDLETAVAPPVAPVGSTVNISSRNGSIVDETQAVEQDIIYRVLTYRGTREWRLLFGTRIFDALTYAVVNELIAEMVSVAAAALSVASNRYRVLSIIGSYRDEILYLTIDAEPLFGLDTPVSVTVPVISLR